MVHGDASELAAAVQARLEAGADHICVQVQPATGDTATALAAIAAVLGLPSKQ